jgi:hypothetical protein
MSLRFLLQRALLAAGLAFSTATTAGGQPGGLPDARPNGLLLHAAFDSILFVSRSTGRADTVARATQSLEAVAGPGGGAWLQVFRYRGSDGTASIDSLMMDGQTLRPLSESRHHPRGTLHLTYSEFGARGVIEPDGESPRMLDTIFTAPVFASASIDQVVRALPLDSGYAAKLDQYFPFPAPFGVRNTEVRVLGAEAVVDGTGREVDCWVVGVILGNDVTRYWIAQTTRRVMQVGEGADLLILVREIQPQFSH